MALRELVYAGEAGPKDQCWVWQHAKDRDGYGAIKVGGKQWAVHRLSYSYHVGTLEPGMQIDHSCSNRACWNPDHLRQVTHRQNMEHKAVRFKNNTSGYRGVYPSGTKWRAMVKHNGRVIHLGTHATALQASLVAEAKREELGFLK